MNLLNDLHIVIFCGREDDKRLIEKTSANTEKNTPAGSLSSSPYTTVTASILKDLKKEKEKEDSTAMFINNNNSSSGSHNWC